MVTKLPPGFDVHLTPQGPQGPSPAGGSQKPLPATVVPRAAEALLRFTAAGSALEAFLKLGWTLRAINHPNPKSGSRRAAFSRRFFALLFFFWLKKGRSGRQRPPKRGLLPPVSGPPPAQAQKLSCCLPSHCQSWTLSSAVNLSLGLRNRKEASRLKAGHVSHFIAVSQVSPDLLLCSAQK